MKKAAERLALFFVITQVDRVAHFLHLFQPADTWFYWVLSYGVAIGLAYGVYVSFFYVRQPKVKWPAVAGIVLFGGFDLVFNELALIRTASAKELISATSSFVWIPAEWLQVAMQASAIAYGLLPTMASGALGWIQGGADKMTDADFGRVTVWQRMGKAMGKLFDTVTARFAMAFEVTATRFEKNDRSLSGAVPIVDGQVTTPDKPKRWGELNADDVAFISANGRKQIMARYGISDGSAGNFKARVAKGEKPWQNAKIPANVP